MQHPVLPCSSNQQKVSKGRQKLHYLDMAGDFVPESELNLKGWQKYFNSYTLRGRFNWVAATYGSLFGIVILYKMFKKKPQPVAAK